MNLMKKSYPENFPCFPGSHLHLFKGETVDFYVFNSSSKWCWNTFLFEGLIEEKPLGIVKIDKNQIDEKHVVKLYLAPWRGLSILLVRVDWIRASDLGVPTAALFKAELRPVVLVSGNSKALQYAENLTYRTERQAASSVLRARTNPSARMGVLQHFPPSTFFLPNSR